MGDFRDNRRSGGFNRGFRDNFGPVEKRKAICRDCDRECEVPSHLKDPVRCTECHRKFKGF